MTEKLQNGLEGDIRYYLHRLVCGQSQFSTCLCPPPHAKLMANTDCLFLRWVCCQTIQRGDMFWEELFMTSKTSGPTPPDNLMPQRSSTPEVNKVTAGDITASLKGWVL